MADLAEFAERWADLLWNEGSAAQVASMMAVDYTDHSLPDSEKSDFATLKDEVAHLRGAFPDLHVEIEDSYEDAEYVILRQVFTGTHRGEYFGIGATNRQVDWDAIDILRVVEDEIAERWTVSDSLALLEQLSDSFNNEAMTPERVDLVARLAAVPQQLRAAVREDDRKRASGDWSTSAILGHLWRTEKLVWQARLDQMAHEENPVWEYWEPDQYDWEAEFKATPSDVVLDAFEFRRAETCDYLRHLTNLDWQRRGTHRTYGELDVAALLERALEHDQEHLATLKGVIL